MAKTISELRNQSIQVRDASAAGENTATRVGTVLNDIVGHIEDYENTQSSNNSSQDAKIEGVKSSLNAEIARAKTEESNLSTQIGTERTERQAAVSREETARIQADNDEKTAREQADNAEHDARIQADNDEKTARENADITLRTMIQTEVSNRQIAVKQEEIRAKAAEKANTQAIEDEAARLDLTDNEIKADLEAETARAQEAELANTTAIEAEAARATTAEEAIIFDVSEHNEGAVFESLQALLSDSNLGTLIPASFRHGGMTIRYVQTSDNKYVQFRLMADAFSTTVSDWQGVDITPAKNSHNLIESGGVKNLFDSQYGYSEDDFGISDDKNSSIVRFNDGHIKTKNFDSSKDASLISRGLMSAEDKTKLETDNTKLATIEEGAEVNNITEEYSINDLEFSDNNNNSAVVFSKGHVKTKNFDSEKIARIENDEAHADFDVTDENENMILSVKDGYPVTKNFNGKKIKEATEDAANRITALEEAVDAIADEIYETVVVNIADYNNNLLNVYDAISPTKNKHYTILIPEGTYDVSSWFTQEYINASQSDSTKRGVVLKDYTKLLGTGSYDKTIFQWMNSDSANYLTNISTLNTKNWNEVENITVKANNIRYAIHDDPASYVSRYLRVKNCAFIVSGNTSRAWGGGFHSGEYNGEFVNCKFIMEDWPVFHQYSQNSYIEPFVLHDYAANTVADSYLTFRNCRFINPYTDLKYHFSSSWEQVTYNASYAAYDSTKTDYTVNDCVNMPNDTEHSYKCLYANTQLPPYKNGRPCVNIGFGTSGATKTLYITIEGCSLNSYLMTNPYLSRITGFGNNMGSSPILSAESTDNKDIIIDII